MKNKQSIKHNTWRRGFLSLATVCCFLFLILTGCRGTFDPPEFEGNDVSAGTGAVLLTINGQGPGRTILPEIKVEDFVKFELEFVSEDQTVSRTWTSVSGTVELTAGTWELSVTAFLPGEDGGQPREAARGILENIEVPYGETVTDNVILTPIREGRGTFSWDINFPAVVTLVRMEIELLDNEDGASQIPEVLYLVGDGRVLAANPGIREMEADLYRVILTLTDEQDRSVMFSAVLQVFHNMESRFEMTFTEEHFSVPLLDIVLGAWDGSAWDFDGSGIVAGHFSLLGITGINGGNFESVVSKFNELSAAGPVTTTLGELKTLTDAALIALAGPSFLGYGNYSRRIEMEADITALVVNSSGVTFFWPGDGTVVVTIGGDHEVRITFFTLTIAVSPSTASVVRGDTQQFTTTVSSAGNPAETVTWSVTGNNDSGTGINTSGILTVAANESATSLTVRATSTANTSVSGIATVTVPAPTVIGVTVIPDTASVARGQAQQFSATVSGTGYPAQTVTWTVTGNNDSGTDINANGLLTVAFNETAASLTVRATSTVNTNISGTATVTVTDLRDFTISFVDFQDMAPPVITVPAFSLRDSPPTVTVLGFDNIRWFVGINQVGQGATLILDRNVHNNRTGTHSVTVEVVVGGSRYSRVITFTVML